MKIEITQYDTDDRWIAGTEVFEFPSMDAAQQYCDEMNSKSDTYYRHYPSFVNDLDEHQHQIKNIAKYETNKVVSGIINGESYIIDCITNEQLGKLRDKLNQLCRK